MDGCPLGLGLVVEDKPTEFSCTYVIALTAMYQIFMSKIHLYIIFYSLID